MRTQIPRRGVSSGSDFIERRKRACISILSKLNSSLDIHLLKKLWRTIWKNQVSPFYFSPRIPTDGRPSVAVDMDLVHAIASRYRFYNLSFPTRGMLKLFQLTFWPFRLCQLAYKFSRRDTDVKARKIHHVSKVVFYSLRYSVPPKAIFNYRLLQADDKINATQFLFDHEVFYLFPYLNNFKSQQEISDKYAFFNLCEREKLPSVAVIGQLFQGDKVLPNKVFGSLEGGFFSKPQFGSRGKFSRSWRQKNGSELLDAKGYSRKFKEVIKITLADARYRSILLQPNLESHEDLNDLSFQNVCTVRIVTVKENGKEARFFRAVLKMPREYQTENTSGLFSAIEESSGILGPCFSYRLKCKGSDSHFDNSAPIRGRLVPDWDAVKKLANHSHSFFPDYLFLGWDIALTDFGPKLLEVNECWDVLTIQRAHQIPLGKTEFVEICKRRIEHFSTAKVINK